MADTITERSGVQGIAFLVGAEFVYNVVASTNSSPQTTEINAKKRAPTLMKWVNIGLFQSLIFILIAIVYDKRNRGPIFFGGLLAGVSMWGQYVYAKECGIRSMEPGTEDYGQGPSNISRRHRR